jgi:hypothetical protein
MAKEKMNNLLGFIEYDHLQTVKKPNNLTEIGGFSMLEKYSIKELVNLARQKTGKSTDELLNMTTEQLKETCISNISEKKASPKQLAARKKFMEMISKKKGKTPAKDEREGCYKCSREKK